jgi:hypothetical protein
MITATKWCWAKLCRITVPKRRDPPHSLNLNGRLCPGQGQDSKGSPSYCSRWMPHSFSHKIWWLSEVSFFLWGARDPTESLSLELVFSLGRPPLCLIIWLLVSFWTHLPCLYYLFSCSGAAWSYAFVFGDSHCLPATGSFEVGRSSIMGHLLVFVTN